MTSFQGFQAEPIIFRKKFPIQSQKVELRLFLPFRQNLDFRGMRRGFGNAVWFMASMTLISFTVMPRAREKVPRPDLVRLLRCGCRKRLSHNNLDRATDHIPDRSWDSTPPA
jgi:hypothetical protein